jgi:hypothetical protein
LDVVIEDYFPGSASRQWYPDLVDPGKDATPFRATMSRRTISEPPNRFKFWYLNFNSIAYSFHL